MTGEEKIWDLTDAIHGLVMSDTLGLRWNVGRCVLWQTTVIAAASAETVKGRHVCSTFTVSVDKANKLGPERLPGHIARQKGVTLQGMRDLVSRSGDELVLTSSVT